MAKAKFRMGDHVRFIGTDTVQTLRHYNENTREYEIQLGDDATGAVWVPAIYLELVEPAEGNAAATGLPLAEVGGIVQK
jgi:hypothetical protein